MEERAKLDTNSEEKKNIAVVLQQVFVAMRELRTKEFNDSDDNIQSIEDWEKIILERDSGISAKGEIEIERKNFVAKYSFHKARLGLRTQNDVAELTGIDRRQISRIENGTKPQFRTLQKIAQAFSISVEEFY
jgi:DNA-binding XRE family transcriptional regulator